MVIVQFVVLKGNNQNCTSFVIERITDWTSEVENELIQEINKSAEDIKKQQKEDVINNSQKYSDPSYIFTSFDLTPINSLDDIRASVKKAYEGMSWSGYYDGSRGEAMDDGENKNRIEMLYYLGKKLGLDLVNLPDFDLESNMEWNGKDGLIEIEDEDN